MSYVTLPYPRLDRGTKPGIVDPDEVNENFKEIARVLNGNIGAENLASARGIAGNVLSAQRAIHGITIGTQTLQGTWPTNGQLFKFHAVSQIVAVGVHAMAAMEGVLRTGPSGGPYVDAVTITDPLAGSGATKRNSFLVTEILSGASAGANDLAVLTVSAGWVYSLTVFFTELHQAPP